MRHLKFHFISIVVVFWLNTLNAQTGTKKQEERKLSRMIEEKDSTRVLSTSITPIATQGAFNLYNGLSFTTIGEDSKISANIKFDLAPNSHLTFKVISALDDNDSESRPITASGLKSGSSLEIGFIQTKWTPRFKLGLISFYDLLRKAEVDYGLKKDSISTLLQLKNALKKSNYEITDVMKRYVDFGSVKRFGFGVSMTKQSFSYVSSLDNLVENNRQEVSLNMEMFYGVITKKNFSHKFSIRAENYFKSQKKGQFQIPTGTSGITRTSELIIGAPTKINDLRFRYEIQKFIGTGDVAINPNLNLLFESEQFFFELPIYFFRKEKESTLLGLNGGIFTSWQSDFDDIAFKSKNFNIGLFIGTDFDFGN
uniref:hypothetical protein n=1 Tax=Roseivirga sp. TaxID=1964215 RepID=UPI0040479E2E